MIPARDKLNDERDRVVENEIWKMWIDLENRHGQLFTTNFKQHFRFEYKCQLDATLLTIQNYLRNSFVKIMSVHLRVKRILQKQTHSIDNCCTRCYWICHVYCVSTVKFNAVQHINAIFLFAFANAMPI